MRRSLIAMLATAAACPAGQHHSGGGPTGRCVPDAKPTAPAVAAPAADPMAPLPPALSSPGTLASTRKVRDGATLRNLSITGLGTIARPDGTASGLTISDVRTNGATDLLRAYTWDAVTPKLTIARVEMLNNGAGGIQLRNASSGTISDVQIVATRAETNCNSVPEGIALAGKSPSDIGGPFAITRAYVENIRTVTSCSFVNGDGFAVEHGYHDVTISYSTAKGNGDAGFDIKGKGAVLNHVVSIDNRRNYKAWTGSNGENPMHWGDVTSIDPGQPGSGAKAHIQVQGSGVLTIDKLTASSNNTSPLFETENGTPTINVGACDLTGLPHGTSLLQGKAVLHLGMGCVVP
jgi:hypothetical protein